MNSVAGNVGAVARSPRQEDHTFEAKLGHFMTLCLQMKFRQACELGTHLSFWHFGRWRQEGGKFEPNLAKQFNTLIWAT